MLQNGLNLMGVNIDKLNSQILTSGSKAYLNALYPNEFEYYMLTLELLDRNGNLKDSLVFPVMPNSISESRQSLVNIKKTNNSIFSTTNQSFAPTSISISGSFGKKIRILVGNKNTSNGSAFYFGDKINNSDISAEVKTGYGATKILERIIKRSQEEKDSLLFLFNHAIGNNYLVECTDMSFSQSLENNMLWNYQINFKSISEAEKVYPNGTKNFKSSIKKKLTFSVLNRSIFQLVNDIDSITKQLSKYV